MKSKMGSAQNKLDSVRQAKNRHFILSWSTGILFIHKSPGQLAISFPYISTNLPSTGEFKGSLSNPFPRNLLLQDLFSLEFLSRHHSIDLHVVFIPNYDQGNGPFNDAFFAAGGYSHNFSPGRHIMIKTGLDLTYYTFSMGLGNIDNRNADVLVFDYDSGPSFTTTTSSGRSTTTTTHTTDHLYIGFAQHILALAPSIRITSPMRQTFYWAIQASWLLPLIDSGGLTLDQVDSAGNSSRLARIGLDQPGITAIFNGRPVTRSPYSLGGLCLGATVGVCLPPGPKHE